MSSRARPEERSTSVDDGYAHHENNEGALVCTWSHWGGGCFLHVLIIFGFVRFRLVRTTFFGMHRSGMHVLVQCLHNFLTVPSVPASYMRKTKNSRQWREKGVINIHSDVLGIWKHVLPIRTVKCLPSLSILSYTSGRCMVEDAYEFFPVNQK